MLESLFNRELKTILLKRYYNTGDFTISCFEKHLQTDAPIICHFDTIKLKQFGFCTTYYFKTLVSERKYKNNLKNCEFQKEVFHNSHGMFVLRRYLVVLPRF